MAWTRKANLKSVIPGPRGPQGLPGVNAVANDTATATYIGDGASATKAALDATYAQVVDLGKLGDPTAGSAMHAAETAGTRSVALTGHSLMYGQDTTEAGTNPPVNGGGLTRSALPTPERFGVMTGYLSPGPVTVVNQAFPGDRSTEALTRWASGTSGAIEFVWIDTNDGTSSSAGPALTDAQTAANLRDFIKRARKRGADVVVVGGAPAQADSDSREIFASAQTDRAIAERMGAKYVDAGELLAALPKSTGMFSSGVHLTKEGYNTVGGRLAALLGPKGVNPPKVGPGRIITPRDGLHVLRGDTAAVATVTGAADGSVWKLANVGDSLAIPVDVQVPCVPVIRALVKGTGEGYGIASLNYNADGSGRSARYMNLTAGAGSLATPAFSYFRAAPLMTPGPDSVVVYVRSGNIEVDSIEFVPITQGHGWVSDPTFDQKRSRTISLAPVGGASAGRASSTWDAMFDRLSTVSIVTGNTGATKVATRWLFDLTLGQTNCGVVLAQSVFGEPIPASMPYGLAQGYMFIRNGTSLIARKLDNGIPTDVTFASAFGSATGNVRCALEIYYDPAGDQFTVYLDGVSLGNVPSPVFKSFFPGLIAGTAGTGSFANGTGSIVQNASTLV